MQARSLTSASPDVLRVRNGGDVTSERLRVGLESTVRSVMVRVSITTYSGSTSFEGEVAMDAQYTFSNW